MKQSVNSTANRRFNRVPGGNGSSPRKFQHGQSAFRVPEVKAAVDRALASAKHAKHMTTHDLRGGNCLSPESLLDHTHSRDRAVPAVDFPPLAKSEPRMSTLYALQEWEGYVVQIEADEFVARLVNLTAGHSHESQEATIPLVEISEYDISCMTVGSIFRWVIGYERSPEGTQKRVSQIVFRDLPRMTESDFSEGKAWARKIVQAISP